MVNLTAAERVYEYWIDKASSAADLVLKIVFAVILFLVARKLILWLCGLIRKNMRRFHTEEAVVSFTVSMVKYSLNTLLVLTIIVQLGIVSEASIAAAIASAGVAVSLALQGGLSNFAGGVIILQNSITASAVLFWYFCELQLADIPRNRRLRYGKAALLQLLCQLLLCFNVILVN